jgi:hypothetical protein
MSVHNLLKFIQKININFSKRDFFVKFAPNLFCLTVRQLMILPLALGKSTSFQNYQLQVKNIDLVD